MSEQNIYNLLRSAGASHIGACAIMGNMQAESSLKSNIAQRGMTKLSDEEYTAKGDAASTTAEKNAWYSDSVGYGLCQWTYWSRKRDLLEYAKLRDTSVGDETTQALFCIKELHEQYSGLWTALCSTTDLYTAVSRVCKEFERPAYNNIETRYSFAQAFTGLSVQTEEAKTVEEETPTESPVTAYPLLWPPRTIQEGKGFDGVEVALVWALLRCRGKTDIVSDNFTAELTALVKEFQQKNGLDADGIIGPKTWRVLLSMN